MKNKRVWTVLMCAFIGVTPVFAGDGDLDVAFANGGVVRTLEAGLAGASDIAIQSDDKIVVVAPKNDDFAVLRYNADGTPDLTFGTGGEVTIDFPDGGISHVRADVPRSVAIAPDGKIVVAGSTSGGLIVPIFDFALARLNPDGTLDSSFGIAGRVRTDFSRGGTDISYDVAIRPSGKIIAVGSTEKGGITRFAVARYNVDGSLDQNFAGTGKTTIGWGGGFNVARSVALQSNGKIVVAGGEIEKCSGNDVGYFALARLRINGGLDPVFGVNGKKRTKFGSCQSSSKAEALAVAIQPDGQIVASGIPFLFGGEWGVVRYNSSDGSLDTTFGTGGKTTIITADNGTSLGGPRATAINNGNVIVVGYGAFYCNDFASADHATLARFDSSGNPDATFGHTNPGLIFFSPYSFSCPAMATSGAGFSANSFALQSDGKIVIAGQDDDGAGNRSLALARFYN